ncbi:MAG: YtxH domain-containing protein [Candidatus Aminicenantes bacterium]|nr:YtxH domain-containing protein [Candidatus Aminicenantes bacterium]
MSEGTGGKMLFSFLSGAVIGAGLALLFAPQSGKKTREQIKEFSEKLGSEVKDEVEKIGGRVRDEVDKFGEKARNVIEGAKETFSKKSRI